jgi:probable HAF family extracellular repeat protein
MQNRTSNTTRLPRAFAVGAASLVLAAGAYAEIQYTVTDLGPIGTGLICRAWALNDLGDAVGDSNPGGGLYPHAVLWTDGDVIDITGLGVSGARATGVNNHGVVVGVTDELELNGFMWQNGVLTQLPSPVPCCAGARDVNDAGRIAGTATASLFGVVEAVYWENGEMFELGVEGEAIAVSEAGHIVGTMWVSASESHAFLWHEGVMTDLGTLGGSLGRACDVNDSAVVVGYSDVPGVGANPFIWENGTMTQLPTLGGMFGYLIGAVAFDSLGRPVLELYGLMDGFERLREWYQNYDVWAVGIAGFTPIPYKVFTISAGFFGLNFPVFVFASIIGRGGRFFLVAALLRLFGEPIKEFIDRYFNWLTLVVAVLFVGGFLVLNYGIR